MKKSNKKCIFSFFFDLQLNIKTFHLLTTSYAKHKASDKLYDSIIELTDKFLEVYLGKYGKHEITTETITFKHIPDNKIIDYLKNAISFLQNDIFNYITENDTELLNIRDEFLESINQSIYLLRLN